ncbi:MAG: hypothetical protein ACR2N3_02725 [Pyrinomonadaceae bacterium]
MQRASIIGREFWDKAVELMGDSRHFVFWEIYQDLARCFLAQELEREALEAVRISLNAAEELKSPEAVGKAWRVLGTIAARLQKSVVYNAKEFTASECFTKSLHIFDEIKMEVEKGRTLRDFARYENKNGNLQKARKMMDEAEGIFTRL